MSEDRRPNVAGRPVPEPAEPGPEAGSDALESKARLLRDRTGADGHEPAPSTDEPAER